MPDEERERSARQLDSHLCWPCFEKLEKSDSQALAVFNLLWSLRRKEAQYRGLTDHYGHNLYNAALASLDKTPERLTAERKWFEDLAKTRAGHGIQTTGTYNFQSVHRDEKVH